MARKGNMKQIDLGVGEEEGREVRGWDGEVMGRGTGKTGNGEGEKREERQVKRPEKEKKRKSEDEGE